MRKYTLLFLLLTTLIPTIAVAAPIVFLIDRSGSTTYTLHAGRLDMGGNFNGMSNKNYQNRGEMMLADISPIIRQLLTKGNSVFIIPWSARSYDTIPVWDAEQATAESLANSISAQAVTQGETNMGAAFAPYLDKKVCEVLAIVTEDYPDDEELIRETLLSILPEQPVAIFVLDYSRTADVVGYYKRLIRHPNLTVDVLTMENVLTYNLLAASEIRPCLIS